jgi:hypothetical protein
MPSGGRRRGAGGVRKPIQEHLAAGTFNVTRHRHLLEAALATKPEPGRERWRPNAEDVKPLGTVGRAYVERIAADWVLDHNKALLLLRAGRVLDRVVLFEQVIRAAAEVIDGKAHPLLKDLRAEIRTYLSLVGALELED